MLDRKVHRRALTAPIHELHVALGHHIVRAKHLVDARRIGRATAVFEQGCIVETLALSLGELQLASKTERDSSGPCGVPRGKALGEVEGAAKGREHLAECRGNISF